MLERRSVGDLDWYTFPRLGKTDAVLAAISTRRGGVSDRDFESLNVSYAVGDDVDRVTANRRRLFGALGVDPAHVVTARQIHGSAVRCVDGVNTGGAERLAVGDVDGMVTSRHDITLTMTFADCVPLLLYDPRHGAVGLGHAGWRGTLLGVASTLVRALEEHYGSVPADVRACIGPSIGPCCYEVGPDVVARFEHRWSWTGDVVSVEGSGRKLDLWEANVQQLIQTGIPPAQIDLAGRCTSCDNAEFFSHRAQRGRAGRFAAVVAMRRL